MRTALIACFTFALVGAGCMPSSKTAGTNPVPGLLPKRTGADILAKALPVNGVDIIHTDAGTGRVFTSVLPPNMRDENGHYPGTQPGEEINVAMAIARQETSDADLFKTQPSLEQFSETDLGGWHTVTAFDRAKNRWVVRATHDDPWIPDQAYHALECLGAPYSTNEFWDACTAMIRRGKINQAIVKTDDEKTKP